MSAFVRFWDDNHGDAVEVGTSQSGSHIIIGATNASEDVSISPEVALKLSRELTRRARAALKGATR